MTSHGWLLVTLFVPLPLVGALFVIDPRAADLKFWELLPILALILLRVVALVMVWRLLWRGVLLGLVPTGLEFVLLLADNLGLLPPAPPPNQTVVALNWGIILLNAGYWVAAYAARTRRA